MQITPRRPQSTAEAYSILAGAKSTPPFLAHIPTSPGAGTILHQAVLYSIQASYIPPYFTSQASACEE